MVAWVKDKFGAVEIEENDLEVGEVVSGVWRPGLFFEREIFQALKTNEYQQRQSEKALRILVEKLDRVLTYIEPSKTGLAAFGHKTRELLILACTEVENYWRWYMALADVGASGGHYTTGDYIKLLPALQLDEFKVKIVPYDIIPAMQPFKNWKRKNPTRSLAWYDAYNETKHDRDEHFCKAKVGFCIEAVCAALVMFCIRFSPHALFSNWISIPSIYKNLFDVSLVAPDRRGFYVPQVDIRSADIYTDEPVIKNYTNKIVPWVAKPFVVK